MVSFLKYTVLPESKFFYTTASINTFFSNISIFHFHKQENKTRADKPFKTTSPRLLETNIGVDNLDFKYMLTIKSLLFHMILVLLTLNYLA